MERPLIEIGAKYIIKDNCPNTREVFGWNSSMYREQGKSMTIKEVKYSARKECYYIRFLESRWSWHPNDIHPVILPDDIKQKIKPILFDIKEIAGVKS